MKKCFFFAIFNLMNFYWELVNLIDLSQKKDFQRRPKGFSLTITSFHQMSNAFILSHAYSVVHNPAKKLTPKKSPKKFPEKK